MKTTAEIRQGFLDYFADQGHQVVRSSPLVPANDPTLLFTNAGMVQFKDVFLGAEKRDYQRAVTAQRCVRAGGKHNDLDQVGYTARHHTFFEMLGNFSFGDYFKQEAIRLAWDFLTRVAGLPAERLLVTVYETDEEAYALWRDEIGLPPERLLRIGDKPGGKPHDSDNFWAMGDTGPCGPCTEIFYDHGPDVAGGPPGSANEDGDRFIEIWNIVFMQFDRDAQGRLKPLPAPSVDTGMGLERLAAVLQGVHSNYDIDLFRHLIDAAAALTGAEDRREDSLKVIADHIRACAFLITDGVLPSNDGRGYVLRRIIRRAIRHGYKLGAEGLFFHQMVEPLVAQMGDAYPELVERQQTVIDTLRREGERFAETLNQGMQLLEGVIDGLEDDEIPGDTAFRLYDTYGFPVDLTADVARERGLRVDQAGFEAAMAAQRERARAAGKFDNQSGISAELIDQLPATEFVGYDHLRLEAARVLAIVVDGEAVDTLAPGQTATLILDRTPFYAEAGGQVGDTGQLSGADREGGVLKFEVTDTIKIAGAYHGHVGQLNRGLLRLGVTLSAEINRDRRHRIVAHHSATHLLHAALREVLGEHVQQKGSLVAADRLRFDFSHPQPVSTDDIARIEKRVNEEIRRNPDTEAAHMSYDDALASGALALFGEKYGDEVRVLRFGDYSVELCGGTHVRRVGDIGAFKIVSEGGIAAGVRRIEAVAGDAAVEWMQQTENTLRQTAHMLKASPDQLQSRLSQVLERNRELEKTVQQLESRLASSAGADLADRAVEVQGAQVLAANLENADVRTLRETLDQLKNRLDRSVIVLGASEDEKVRLIAGVSAGLTDTIKAGELVNYVAQQVGGRGGGRPDMAQAGGSEPEKLGAALDSVRDWVNARLSGASGS